MTSGPPGSPTWRDDGGTYGSVAQKTRRHLTLWGGGGNIVVGQSEGGFTLAFHGTGSDGTLDVHSTGHNTVSASGNQVANQQHGKITCS
jgi:hypothetical protein